MEIFKSLIQESITIFKILWPAGIINVGLAYYFLKNKITLGKAIGAMFFPIIIFVFAIFTSEEIVNLIPTPSKGDGLEGFWPGVLIALFIICFGFYYLYKKILHFNGKQIMVSILAMIISGITALWFLA